MGASFATFQTRSVMTGRKIATSCGCRPLVLLLLLILLRNHCRSWRSDYHLQQPERRKAAPYALMPSNRDRVGSSVG
jgi:hypothetical protein